MGRFINADAYASTGQGILGNNMFAYCLNNPIRYKDAQGYTVVDCYDTDGEIFSSDELDERGGGSGSGASSWSIFLQCLDDATSGLTMTTNRKDYSGTERHHIVSDKNHTYTPQYKEITDRHNYSLSQKENIIELENHKGRHTNAYHGFILTVLKSLDVYADGNSLRFLQGIAALAKYIEENPWIPYAQKEGK